MLRSLFKRSGKYFLGLITSKVLTSIAFILLARYFQPSVFGEIVFYWALIQLFTSWSDFGLIQWYQKKAHALKDHRSLLAEMIEARIATLILSITIATFMFYIGGLFSPSLIALFIITLIPEAFNSIFDAFYLAKHQSPKVATKSVLKLSLSLIGYALLWSRLSFAWVFVIVCTSSVLTLLWYTPWNYIVLKSLDAGRAFKNLRSSSHYALLIVTSYAYAQGDSIIIRLLRGSSAIGFYGAAYRYLETAALLPTALQHNLFPLSAKSGTISTHQLKKMVFLMGLVGTGVALCMFALSDFLVVGILGPSYEAAIAPLQVFSLVIFLFFINSPLATIVQSSDLLRKFLPFGIANTALNLILNILIVPSFGIIAAAWIMFLTELTGLLINIYFVKKVYQ